jgi:hypothetical protein
MWVRSNDISCLSDMPSSLGWSPNRKLKFLERSNQGLMRYSSSKLAFKIWGWYNQWLLRCSILNILRFSFIVNIASNFIYFLYSLISSFKFEDESVSSVWDIPLLIFEVVFIYSNFPFWFGPLGLSWGRSNIWLLRYSNLNILR